VKDPELVAEVEVVSDEDGGECEVETEDVDVEVTLEED